MGVAGHIEHDDACKCGSCLGNGIESLPWAHTHTVRRGWGEEAEPAAYLVYKWCRCGGGGVMSVTPLSGTT